MTFEDLEDLVFLDGGMMSNLPSDPFRDFMPDVPTIVVPFVGGSKPKEITRRRKFADLGVDIGACASAVRLQRDREIWLQNASLEPAFDLAEKGAEDVLSGKRPPRRYPVEIAPIDTGEANWLNFVISGDEKATLFLSGVKSAHELLAKLKKGKSK